MSMPSRHLLNVVVMARIVPLAVAAGDLSAQSPAPAQYDGVSVTRNVMIPVRDGKLMATDLYRPMSNGAVVTAKLPVLLNRTPYEREREDLVTSARYFAQRGYVVAVQSLRGRFNSQGVFLKVQPADATDGYDAIEWLAHQPFANGKVGMWGQSFSAHSQAGAAQLKPPSLATLVLNMGGLANGWDHGVRYRGAYEMGRQLTWAWTNLLADTKRPEVKALLEREKVESWYALQPMKRGLNPLSIEPNFEAWYLDYFQHADYDDFWKDRMLNWSEHYDETSDVPMLHVGGWYDIFLAGTFQNFVELGRRNKTPQRLLIGPWTHSGNLRPFAGDVAFGASAAIPTFHTAFQMKWFDHFMKGISTEVESEAPLRLFVMGLGDGHKDADGRLFHGGTWRDYPSWPVPGTKLVNYYFHGDGTLSRVKATEMESATTYTFDPAHPVPTIGGGSSARLKDGAYDQREDPRFPPSAAPFMPLRARRDVLVFQTEPLTEDLTVIGPITVTLHASTNRTDTDFTAKLIDVYPPSAAWPGGYDLNLTDAIVRGRYRATREHQVLLKPGQVYEFTVAPFPTANVFKKGHRIRVDISSSNFPRFDVNPGTGEPLGKNIRMVTQDNTVHHSARFPSHIVLPVAPAVK